MTSNPDIEVTILEDDDEITDPSGHPRQNGDIEMASPSATGSAAQAAEVETSMDVEEVPSRVPFSEYLKSPIVSLHIGAKDARHSLSAHRALLDRSPYFAGRLAQGQTSFTHEELELDQVACFLEWLYTGDYFPRISFDGDAQAGLLEVDPSLPAVDVTGEQILKHAKVYTLAEKFGLPELKSLSTSKIYRVNSSARGEIAYARYIYGTVPEDDHLIRKPIAAFWAHRSHVLRHDAEDEFKTMCLDFPKFAYDVLTLVLDHKEKGKGDHLGEGSARRKRPRTTTAT